MDLQDLDKPAGKNAPGLSNTAWLAPKSWFSDVKGTTAVPVLAGDTVIIEGDHTFEVGKGFISIYTTYKTAKAAAEKVGEADSTGTTTKFEAFYPGTAPAFAEFLADDDEYIALFGDVTCSNTQYIQLGSKCLPAKVSGGWESGQAGGEGKKGFTFTIESYAASMLFYPGVVTLYP